MSLFVVAVLIFQVDFDDKPLERLNIWADLFALGCFIDLFVFMFLILPFHALTMVPFNIRY